MIKTTKTQSKKPAAADSKLDQLAKIMYEGIVRCIKAKNARDREKKGIFVLDSDRKQRKNVSSIID